jgi:rhamnogalacturonan endolyase
VVHLSSDQWFKDNGPVPGGTDATLTISSVQASNIGSYTVVVTNRAGSVTSNAATLSIAAQALVRHAPALNSAELIGSLQQMLAEDVALNGNTSVSGDLLVPGTPNVLLNGSPNYGGTLEGSGNPLPSNYRITLNSNSSLGHVVRRTDAVSLPVVDAPLAPAGTRTVILNNATQSVGDWATLRNLTLNGHIGQIAVPAGACGDFTANGGTGFTLGIAGATQPAVYYFQHLTFSSGAQMQVVGPVVVVVGSGFDINGSVLGNSNNPTWLTLNIYSGDVALNTGANVYGYVTAPAGTVMINGNTQIMGGVACDRLTINSGGQLRLLAPSN